jgi:hypothetical protein
MIKYEKYNISGMFNVYMCGSVIASIIFFIEFFSAYIGFRYGYDVRLLGLTLGMENGKILPAALFSEPAHFAMVLSPAMFVSLHNVLTGNKLSISLFSSILILTAYILCFSSTGYIAIFIALAVLALNYRTFTALLTTIIIGIFAFIFMYNNVPKFRTRFDDSKVVFIDKNIKNKKILLNNGSTMTLYNNYYVAINNFLDHPLFGTGIGSHYYAHDRYRLFSKKLWWIDLNKDDANSLFNRLISETGLFGIMLYSLLLIRYNIKKSREDNTNKWIISNAILVLLLINIVRQGHYVAYGFPAFILMYYYLYKSQQRNLITIND